MELVAKISREWRRRMLLMYCMLFGIAAWFLSDGYIIWPNEAERYVAYGEIRDELEAAGEPVEADSHELRMAWERHAKEAGYPIKKPKERTHSAIREQRVIGWVLMAGSMIFVAWIAWNHRLTIEAHGETVIGASGERVGMNSIVATDRRKWQTKGIAYAIYEADGKRKRLCLDEHKFKGCEAILLEAERRISERKAKAELS